MPTTTTIAVIDTAGTQIIFSTQDQEDLTRLERQIEHSKRTFFYDVGHALREINKRQLYLVTHTSFETYVEEHHDMKRDRAYKLISAVEAAGNIKQLAAGFPEPTAERQLRELADLPAEEQAAVWIAACTHKDAKPGKPPAGALVQRVIEERQAAQGGTAKKAARKAAPAEDATGEHDEPEPTSDDLFTPANFAQAVRDVLGKIELDPASCAEANDVINAGEYFTIGQDGLAQDWTCETLYLNPPYSRGNVDRFVAKLLAAYDANEVGEAILLVNAATGTSWFPPLYAFPCCFVRGRIPFVKSKALAAAMEKKAEEEGKEVPKNGNYDSVFVYLGPNVWRFVERFREFGTIVTELRVPVDE